MNKYLTLLLTTTLLCTMVFAEEKRGDRDYDLSLDSENFVAQVSRGEEELIERSAKGATFATTYPGAYHKPFRVSLFGDEVELEDGSIWKIRKSDRTKTYDWLTFHDIAITINHSWFSNCQFCLTNLATGKRVEADLLLGPIYNGAYTRFILSIDYLNCQICLNDGSVWDVSGFDRFTLDRWLINHTVIIGHDDTLLGRTNILINVTAPKHLGALTFVSADCVY